MDIAQSAGELPITIPGLDAAYFADASSDSVNVAFSVTTGVHRAIPANISGSIDGLYPASGTTALLNGRGRAPVSILRAADRSNVYDGLRHPARPVLSVVQATSADGLRQSSISIRRRIHGR